MDKRELAEKILESLKKELSFLESEYRRVSKEAINAPSFMESQHDTTKQEMSYEASRIEKRAGIISHTLKEVTSFIPTIQKNDSVMVGSLVNARTSKGKEICFFILPFGEGEVVDSIMVLSPQSPIFREMRERKEGDTFSFRGTSYTIEKID